MKWVQGFFLMGCFYEVACGMMPAGPLTQLHAAQLERCALFESNVGKQAENETLKIVGHTPITEGERIEWEHLRKAAEGRCHSERNTLVGWTALHESVLDETLHPTTIRIQIRSLGRQAMFAEHVLHHAPYHTVIMKDAVVRLMVFLEEGLPLEYRDFWGRTLLHFAVECGAIKCLSLLHRRGALVNVRDNKQWTPLHDAARNGNVPVVKWLLENGAEVNALTDKGLTALHVAAESVFISPSSKLFDYKSRTEWQFFRVACVLRNAGMLMNARTYDECTDDGRTVPGRTAQELAQWHAKEFFSQYNKFLQRLLEAQQQRAENPPTTISNTDL